MFKRDRSVEKKICGGGKKRKQFDLYFNFTSIRQSEKRKIMETQWFTEEEAVKFTEEEIFRKRFLVIRKVQELLYTNKSESLKETSSFYEDNVHQLYSKHFRRNIP